MRILQAAEESSQRRAALRSHAGQCERLQSPLPILPDRAGIVPETEGGNEPLPSREAPCGGRRPYFARKYRQLGRTLHQPQGYRDREDPAPAPNLYDDI